MAGGGAVAGTLHWPLASHVPEMSPKGALDIMHTSPARRTVYKHEVPHVADPGTMHGPCRSQY